MKIWREKMVEVIRKWLRKHNYSGIILSRRDNYAWLTKGAQNHVLSCSEYGIAYYLITDREVIVMADSSDIARIAKEQNPLNAFPVEIPWYETAGTYILKFMANEEWVSDTRIAGTKNVQNELVELRLHLSENEVNVYREIGAICAETVESVCQEIRVGQTEKEVAAMLKAACLKQEITPGCVLVGADERILNYRHPMPTDKKINQSVMVVLGSEKKGLNISMTRMVHFGKVSDEIRERYAQTQHIFACMQLMMKAGMTYQEYFEKIKQLYASAGYPEEWKKHHQGGPTGYACREYVITPGDKRRIKARQAYAWNPTIQGTKSEETTYFNGKEVEILTKTKKWPRKNVKTIYGNISVAEMLEK